VAALQLALCAKSSRPRVAGETPELDGGCRSKLLRAPAGPNGECGGVRRGRGLRARSSVRGAQGRFQGAWMASWCLWSFIRL
jgi:hypothetical protein